MAKISIIGSGRVATQLGKKLYAVGHTIVQIYSRNLQTAQALSVLTESVAITNVQQLESTADIYIVAIKDDAIKDLCPFLKNIQNKIIAHTSGTIPSTIFESYIQNYGVFYPLQTFSAHKDANFDTLPFVLTFTLLMTIKEQVCM